MIQLSRFRDLVAGADGIASNEAEAFREKSLLLEGAANENGAKAELSAQDAEARAKAALLKIQEIMAALHGHSAHVVGDYEKDGPLDSIRLKAMKARRLWVVSLHSAGCYAWRFGCVGYQHCDFLSVGV